MRVELLYFKGCPGFEKTLALIQDVMKCMGINSEVKTIDINDCDSSYLSCFLGSPTVLIDGEDIELKGQAGPIMNCRLYQNSPVPERYLIEAAFIRRLLPSKILFMCVGNSARSILAEAIARDLAKGKCEVLSAGSEPKGVREETITVLKEVGIHTDNLYSKSVSDIQKEGIGVVITLCKEEVCPVFLGKAIRLHWAFEDPAAIVDESERLKKFREIRDQLMLRIGLIFGIDFKRNKL